ncbi:nitrogen regulatory protein P-II family [Desulfotomaculum arcticum]|uniref:Nitrogen regulatory protein P-II family n=1 Tax=Desulfotruncus arcticus DSM 17038 TaxID=1121424 RepID=A0A1I2U488_9FIRM|nr:P-II family nitrogen regulator [Desulfotruncus arcticus]SFG70467.1 nitrogen regulatory protein P-II family [Desulfotomaculum arcticum] [Desulfotruncus arcticus DSM 17038]
MVKIEAIVRPGVLEEIKEGLSKSGVHGMTVSQVMGCGLQKGRNEVYRGTEYSINLLPKVKIELVIKDSLADKIIEVISKVARTGEIGDGKIFVYHIENAIRIRTGETGENAI